MDNIPIVVQVDLGSAAWAVAMGGVLALVVLCLTCVVLCRSSGGYTPEVLSAFADVIRAFRRRPRGDNEASATEPASMTAGPQPGAPTCGLVPSSSP